MLWSFKRQITSLNGTTEILGYFGALIVGLVLGLIGGGGSILTVPILVYLLGFNPISSNGIFFICCW